MLFIRCTKSVSIFVFLLMFLYFINSASVFAASNPISALIDGITKVLHLGGDDSVAAINPVYLPAKGGKRLDPSKFYVVQVICKAKVNSAEQISSGLLVKESKFVAHVLWVSDASASADGAVPTNPAKLINVFSFDKNSSGQIVNTSYGTCSDTFLIKGNSSTLTISFSQTDTKELAPLGSFMYGAAKIVSGVASLFLTGPLYKTVVNDASVVGGTQDPIKTIIGAINNSPEKAVASTFLLASDKGLTTIETKYSVVTLKVSPVDDITSQITKDKILLSSFYTTLKAMSANYLNGITAATLADKCGGFAGTLGIDYTFGRKDNSFILGYFAQSAFPADLTNRLSCIGNIRNAQDIIDYEFIYNVKSAIGLLVPIQQSDIDNFFADAIGSRVLLNSKVAAPYVYSLTGLLSIYAQETVGTKKTDEKVSLSRWMGDKTIKVEDLTHGLWPENSDVLPGDFDDNLSAHAFKRFGCYWLKPTVGAGAYDAVFLALPLSPSKDDSYSLDELLAIRVALSGDKTRPSKAVVTNVQITGESPAIFEAANNNKGICGSHQHITLPVTPTGTPGGGAQPAGGAPPPGGAQPPGGAPPPG